jgi:exodeoxyribonuclease V alpha subunit
MGSLAEALGEALPRLHGCPPNPEITALVEGLTAALLEGSLDMALPSEGHRQAVLASALGHSPDGPLVVEGDRLMWRRWWAQRQEVLEALLDRASQPHPTHLDQPQTSAELSQSVAAKHRLDPQQRKAVQAVLERQLVLLEGGPGTGKTSTVLAIVEAVVHLQPDCRIQLAAPTGKAAARLKAATAPLTLHCTTLHRLLESRGERFGRNRRHPLPLDLVVVDEVSMVDLALMQALLEALASESRLVLVGDSGQLPPIGAGAVLLELNAPEQRQRLGDAAVRLQTTYRNNGAIAAVASTLVGTPDDSNSLPPATLAALANLGASDNLLWQQQSPRRLPDELLLRLRQRQLQLQQLCQSPTTNDSANDQEVAAAQLLAELETLLVLTPLRRGRWGVEAIHQELLGAAAQSGPQHWPIGTPVLCQRNLNDLGLANGDVGLVVEREGSKRLLFGVAGSVAGSPAHLLIHPAQLPEAQPAFALTVHKAQGSEADEVWILMGELGRPSHRLLYTALTRAKRKAILITATS